MSMLLTGDICLRDRPELPPVLSNPDVTTMWVDVDALGRSEHGVTWPVNRTFDLIVYVVELSSLSSTQMQVHFAETKMLIQSHKQRVWNIGDSACPERFLGALSVFPSISLPEILNLLGE